MGTMAGAPFSGWRSCAQRHRDRAWARPASPIRTYQLSFASCPVGRARATPRRWPDLAAAKPPPEERRMKLFPPQTPAPRRRRRALHARRRSKGRIQMQRARRKRRGKRRRRRRWRSNGLRGRRKRRGKRRRRRALQAVRGSRELSRGWISAAAAAASASATAAITLAGAQLRRQGALTTRVTGASCGGGQGRLVVPLSHLYLSAW